MYIDVHCHLTAPEFFEVGGVAAAVKRAEENGVGLMICSGCEADSSTYAKEIAEAHENVYFCAGLHPGELHKYREGDLDRIRALCQHEKCVAVGEIGLDYHFDNNPAPEIQRDIFHKQLVLADELGLPVVIHSRDAAKETLDFLKERKHLLRKGGVMHCYSYSAEMMREFIALGFKFSFGGPCTFKNANKVQECVRCIPAPLLLSETDCPYLTPVPLRGVFPNEPKNVKHVVDFMATLRNENVEELQKQILANAKELFFKLK